MGAESPKEECGLFGVWAPGDDVARLTYFGLFAQQHRGQESCGIAVSDGQNVRMHKDMGLVSQVFNEEILAIREKHAWTAFFVTHSVAEAVFLSNPEEAKALVEGRRQEPIAQAIAGGIAAQYARLV